ncbi:5'/3'-nucleotidase SurE [Tundrisphaera sp. TA3]|uniref:5'/3'-nucleotidase SurE n=1 Tax=Tundrisphaera sp. TA3 TaxID=3435775 RepID=UPI003EBEB307
MIAVTDSEPTLILTNDDGIDAPGLAALEKAASGLGRCLVFAPSGPQSGCGHVVTTHAPIAVDDRGASRTAVGGTPADCVRMALHRGGTRIDWVLSGINAGGNLGTDIHHSGTVAAVREATIHGIGGIAVSHYLKKNRAVDWDRAARWCRAAFRELMARPALPGTFWNVNLPHLEPGDPEPSLVFCEVDPAPLPLAFRDGAEGLVYCGDYQGRSRRPGADVAVCFGGQISVSRVHVMTSVGPEA